MSKSIWNLQVNTRAGYQDTEPPEEPLRHHVNYEEEDDEEILLPTQFNGKSKKAKTFKQQNILEDDSDMLYPIGINPK